MRTYWEVVLLEYGAVFTYDIDCRALGPVLGVDDDLVGRSRELVVAVLAVGNTLSHVFELQGTCNFDDGRCIVSIPFADSVTLAY